MIKAVWAFLQLEIMPRWRRIVFTEEFIIPIFAGMVIYHFVAGGKWVPSIQAHSFLTGLITYASIAFGFSVTGASVSLALPHSFIRSLADSKEYGTDKFTDLIFVFTWTGLIHVSLLVINLLGFCVYAEDAGLFDANNWKASAYGAATITLTVYCVLQFTITIFTLAAVARVYRNRLG